jgi:hypothetical protein
VQRRAELAGDEVERTVAQLLAEGVVKPVAGPAQLQID